MTVANAKIKKMVPAAAPPRLAATGSDSPTINAKKSCSPAMTRPTLSHTSVTDVAQAANEFLYCLLDRLLDGCAGEGDLAVLIVKDDEPLVAVLDGLGESVASLCCKNLQLLEH